MTATATLPEESVSTNPTAPDEQDRRIDGGMVAATNDGERTTLEDVGSIDPARVHVFEGPLGVLRCTLEGEKSVLRVKVVRAFPLSAHSRWISLLDAKNKEVCLIEDPDQLDPESQRLVEQALGQFYRQADILKIYSVRQEYRTMFWDVETERGRRDFVVKWAVDTVNWRGSGELLLVDIDTNRFHIPDVTVLDKHSMRQLSVVL
jgi:hypothetical protein